MASTKRTEWENGTSLVGALSSKDTWAVAELFGLLDGDPFFTPHPFTAEEAARVCDYKSTHPGGDLYLGCWLGRTLVGYAMLRGWDAGFKDPSLGIAVAPEWRGVGVGSRMMRALHAYARGRMQALSGVFNGRRSPTKVRLRVHPDHVRAKAFYERFGYVFDGEMDRGELVGWFDLVKGDVR